MLHTLLNIAVYTFAAFFIAVAAIAWFITVNRRAKLLYADSNSINVQGDWLTMPAPIAANAGVGPIANDPLMYGTGTSPGFGLACVAQTSYTQPSGLVPTGNISVAFKGVFLLAVVGKNSVGGSSHAFAIGDKVYLAGGTYDATTGCTYGGTLNNDATNGAYFGNVLDIVPSASTTTVRVRLKVAG